MNITVNGVTYHCYNELEVLALCVALRLTSRAA